MFPVTLFVSSASGQREVEIDVYGSSVLQTDIRTYKIYSEWYENEIRESVTVQCKISIVPAFSTLLLTKDSKTLDWVSTEEYNTGNTAIKIFKYNSYNEALSIAGTYFCRSYFTNVGSNESVFTYSMVTKFSIVVGSPIICASDIGSSGYSGESAMFRCVSSMYVMRAFYSYFSEGRLVESLHHSHGFNVLVSYTTQRFGCYRVPLDAREKICQKRIFIHQFLRLELSQTNNDIFNPATIEFFCKSTPPRLMYWEVFEENGNILNLYQFNQSTHIEGNITIRQSVGQTSIRISGSSVTQKRIHTVLCSTYDTRARVVAYVILQTRGETACEERAYTCPSDTQATERNHEATPLHENTFPGTLGELTKRFNAPDIKSTSMPQRTPMSQETPMPQDTPMSQYTPMPQDTPLSQSTPVPQSTPMPQDRQMPQSTPLTREEEKVCYFTGKDHYLLLSAVFLLLIIIFIMTVTIFYMIQRFRKSSKIQRDLTLIKVCPAED